MSGYSQPIAVYTNHFRRYQVGFVMLKQCCGCAMKVSSLWNTLQVLIVAEVCYQFAHNRLVIVRENRKTRVTQHGVKAKVYDFRTLVKSQLFLNFQSI